MQRKAFVIVDKIKDNPKCLALSRHAAATQLYVKI